MDLLELLFMCACTEYFAEASSSDAMLCHDLILDSRLPSIFLVLCVAMYAASSCTPQISRECWKLQREDATWQGVQSHAHAGEPSTRDREWQKLYRMSYPSFKHLLTDLRPYIENPSKGFVREPIDTERAVAMVIHRLASGASPRAIADMYNTGASTVTKYTKLITGVLASHTQLYSKYIAIPTGATLSRIIRKYSFLTGIPNVCGSIGGTHIKLHSKPKPAYSPADYLSSYGFFSVLLQGVCDADKLFWDVCCNAPGGLDDATHLRASSLWRKMVDNEILVEPRAIVQGRAVRPFLTGDGPYPLMPFLITPFNTAREDALVEIVFDSQLMKARARIDAAFGVMKNRWKILKNINTDLKYVAQTVIACCVLHNFCQLAGEPEQELDLDEYASNRFQVPAAVYENEVDLQQEGMDNRRALFWDWFRRRHEEAEEERLGQRTTSIQDTNSLIRRLGQPRRNQSSSGAASCRFMYHLSLESSPIIKGGAPICFQC